MNNNVVMFDKLYSADEIAEGRAVQWAVITGACTKCKYLKTCANEIDFEFPKNAPCMEKKEELLKENDNAD